MFLELYRRGIISYVFFNFLNKQGWTSWHLIHPPVKNYLWVFSFLLLKIMQLWKLVHDLQCHIIFLGLSTESELLGCRVYVTSALLDNTKMFSKVIVPCYIPTSGVWVSELKFYSLVGVNGIWLFLISMSRLLRRLIIFSYVICASSSVKYLLGLLPIFLIVVFHFKWTFRSFCFVYSEYQFFTSCICIELSFSL